MPNFIKLTIYPALFLPRTWAKLQTTGLMLGTLLYILPKFCRGKIPNNQNAALA